MAEYPEWLSRTVLMIGEEKLQRLRESHVLVAGMGGVGSWAAEFLVRAGIGELSIVDHDRVSVTNRNRQLPATLSTTGQLKVEVMKERLLDINPELKIHAHTIFLKDEATPALLDLARYDFVVDAIDTLSPKIFFIRQCVERGLPLVSSMGAGNKLDPSHIKAVDISKTHNCRLAHYIRKHLHKLGIYEGFTAVYSPERPEEKTIEFAEGELNKRTIVGTISYMPAMFGGVCASVVIRKFLGDPANN
ncbi:MAG: tRNA threonylcarbamoyladenosine dehydratase [Bacteroidales bacterium]